MKLSIEQTMMIRECSRDEEAFQKIMSIFQEPAGEMMGEKKLIIVVDDEATVSSFVRLVLEQEGFATLTAASGKACLEIMDSHTPDLILLDISMPDMDGGELFSRVRALPNGHPVPVIFVTGLISPDEEAEFNKTREDRKCYIGKPFTPMKLISVVKAMLANPDE